MQITLLTALVWAAGTTASAIDLLKRDTPLVVELTALDNSKVKAAITNTDSRGYNLFYKGSFLDGDAPVDKFTVEGPSSRAAFNGVLLRMATTNLDAYDFLAIESGQTISTEVDVAEIYDVERSDDYVIRATGSMPFANLNSTTLTGNSVAFSSNAITMSINGTLAHEVPYAINNLTPKRTALRTQGCTTDRRAALTTALSNCAALSANAASAARAGHKLSEHFRSNSRNMANTVSARFSAVARECSSRTHQTTTSCADEYGFCQPGVLGYTLPSYNYIGYCEIFYERLQPLTRSCHGQDQATTVIHEKTHSPAVFSPGTLDYAYGYASSRDLSSQQAVLNADTYALYANALYVGC